MALRVKPPVPDSADDDPGKAVDVPAGMDLTDDQAEQALKRCQTALRVGKAFDEGWKPDGVKGWEFYYGKQWADDDADEVEEREQVPLVLNEVKPTIDTLLGLQSVQPMDWLPLPKFNSDEAITGPATASMKHVADENYADDQFSHVYFDSLTFKIGWIATGFHIFNPDPLAEEVQFGWIDPREMTVDPKQRRKDLQDARWMIRSREVPLSVAKAAYAEFADELEASSAGDDSPYADSSGDDAEHNVVFDDGIVPPADTWDLDWNHAEKSDDDDEEDPENRPVVIHEMWERYIGKGLIARKAGGYKLLVDPDDEDQMLMFARDPEWVIDERPVDLPKIRYWVFSGDLLLAGGESPYKHGMFPFVPCWYDRDHLGRPVGLVDAMIDAQSELNHRHSRLLFGLLARTVRIDPTALVRMKLTAEEAEEKAAQPDAVWFAKQNDVEIIRQDQTSQEQFAVYEDLRRSIREVAHVWDDLQGRNTSSRSGIAKEIASSNSQLGIRPRERNLRLCHKLVGDQVWSLIQQAHGHDPKWQIRVTNEFGGRAFIPLGGERVDPVTGQTEILGDPRQARFEFAMDQTPWSPTMKARWAEQLFNVADKIPDPGMRNRVIAMAIVASEVPKQSGLGDLLHDLMNPPPPKPQPRPPSVSVNYRDLPPDTKGAIEEDLTGKQSAFHAEAGPSVAPLELPRPA